MEINVDTPLTLAIGLGRFSAAWPHLRWFLERQRHPPELTTLLFINRSTDRRFIRDIQSYLFGSRYKASSLISMDSHRGSLAREYSSIRDAITTPLLWLLGEGVIPTLDAGTQMKAAFCRHTVSVTASYHSSPHHLALWDDDRLSSSLPAGVSKIRGNGFGCLMLRSAAFRQELLDFDDSNALFLSDDSAKVFYHRLHPTQLVKVAWDAKAQFAASTERDLPPYSPTPPSPEHEFDEEYYGKRNPDVAAAIASGAFVSGKEHYELHGRREGRLARGVVAFDEAQYFDFYPEVLATIVSGQYVDAREHLDLVGRFEGKSGRMMPLSPFPLPGEGAGQ